MNIDLRNISEEFENSINEIKSKHKIATNSKAVEHAVTNHIMYLNTIERLNKELSDTKKELSSLKYSVDSVKSAFRDFLFTE